MSGQYPFLISIPHAGTRVPPELYGRVNLSREEIVSNSDPHTHLLYGFGDRAAALVDFEISRVFVDTNRPPYDYPPRAQDGVVKVITQDGTPVFRKGQVPGKEVVGVLLKKYYYPFHERLTAALDTLPIEIAFDCHSMLPRSPPVRVDSGRERPIFCLSNRGDRNGRPRSAGGLVTCPPEWLQALARSFQAEFDGEGKVAMNDPFRGGFISVAHYRHRRIPWVQVEISRGLYETEGHVADEARLVELRERIFASLADFWDGVSG
ncbi:N-formylglutamate amidohydrolase [Methanoculleus sp.]|uniref:N-formylglutamate amidohydrolase n=1 Tax=Methanoculleus sp. TaxID=90427 RepID=UPI0025CCD0C8|nr:N-formylglutamate amidohydrolase [Methanoculleus sp.]